MKPQLTVADKIKAYKIHYKKIFADIEPACLSQVFAELESPSILGGNPTDGWAERFSVWAAEPKQIFEFSSNQDNPFEKLDSVINSCKVEDLPAGLPKGIFVGGWIGYFSYDLNLYIEKLPSQAVDDLNLPLIRLCFYDRVICYDRIEKCFYLIAAQSADDVETANSKLNRLEDILDIAAKTKIKKPPKVKREKTDTNGFSCNMTKEYYFEAFDKIKKHIYDGDVYQINFSQRFESDYTASPINLYHWQNQYNPSPYAAYIDAGGFAVVSASPELFIRIQDGTISTKPIKGTRARNSKDSRRVQELNARNYSELLNSEKEQAELNMIIDLERNDLGRICLPGTIKVVQPRTIEAYPTVFHAVATIEGRLSAGVCFTDVLKAVFPGGSITGAPKIRTMEIIEQLEPTKRNIYTGSVGFIGLNGNVCLNIAIRTVIINRAKAFAQTGGGIVADSDPSAEWQETLIKAGALLEGIRSVKNGR